MNEPNPTPAAYSCAAESLRDGVIACARHCGDNAMCPNTLTKTLDAGAPLGMGHLSPQAIEAETAHARELAEDDFLAGKTACDLSGEGSCESCQ